MAPRTRQAPTPIRSALENGSTLHSFVRDGVDGIEKKDRVCLKLISATIADSLNLDAALLKAHPKDKRWDHLLGHAPSEVLVGVEVHKAEQGEVSRVIAKKNATAQQLTPHLKAGRRVSTWLWVATDKVLFADTEKTRRRLDQSGIKFVHGVIRTKDLE